MAAQSAELPEFAGLLCAARLELRNEQAAPSPGLIRISLDPALVDISDAKSESGHHRGGFSQSLCVRLSGHPFDFRQARHADLSFEMPFRKDRSLERDTAPHDGQSLAELFAISQYVREIVQ